MNSDEKSAFAECLTRETARKILEFRPDEETQTCLQDLAVKADAGQLDDNERAKYQDYVEAFDLLAILKAKARRVLSENDS